MSSMKEEDDPSPSLRILLYVTTHCSNQHLAFVEQCWPYLVQNSELIGMSDILIFSTGSNSSKSEWIKTKLEHHFDRFDDKSPRKHNISLIHYDNPGYHGGANLPLKEASQQGWFRGYDWVVRINPDVLIYNDSWILDVMRSDKNASGIFADCTDRKPDCTKKGELCRPLLHSDFWAVRASDFPEGKNSSSLDISRNAEAMTTRFFQPLLQAGKARWLPDTGLHKMVCRVGWQNRNGTHVYHNHAVSKCPQPKLI